MKVSKIIFSPTGGTRRAADMMVEEWGMPAAEIDLTSAGIDDIDIQLDREDVALIAVPSYGGRVPLLAAQRIAKLSGNQMRCVIVCVYGNRAYEDTLIELKDLAEKSGFQVIAAVAAIAEHSIMHQYAAGRPDAEDERQLRQFAKDILNKLKDGEEDGSALKVPGNHPYKKAGGAGLVPKAGSACIGCAMCAKNCPAQAISGENLKKADSQKCISCMRCVVKCPVSARKVNGLMVFIASQAIKKACSVRKENELYL